jgi:CBS domain-containing protein
MARDRIEIHVDPEVAEAIAVMLRSHVSGVPVLDVFLRTLADLLSSDVRSSGADAQIRKSVLRRIDERVGRVNGLVRIDVTGGVVEVRGVIVDEAQRRALREAIEGAPGVAAFHDRLVWIDPATGAFLVSADDSAMSNPPARVFGG